MVIYQTTPEDRKEIYDMVGAITGTRQRDPYLMGALITQRHIGGRMETLSELSPSIRIEDVNGVTVMVFTTRSIAGESVEPHHTARVYTDDPNDPKFKGVSIFYFVRCDWPIKTVVLAGWTTPSRFFREAVFNPKGETDSFGGYICRRDEFTLPLTSLFPPEEPFSESL